MRLARYALCWVLREPQSGAKAWPWRAGVPRGEGKGGGLSVKGGNSHHQDQGDVDRSLGLGQKRSRETNVSLDPHL